jgi:Arc/MetJ-type ribon-helix-helix transcriptional regulator
VKKKTLQRLEVDVPEQLYHQMETLIQEGWFRDAEEIVNLALRKFLHSHRPGLMAKHLREDVEWGMRGGK